MCYTPLFIEIIWLLVASLSIFCMMLLIMYDLQLSLMLNARNVSIYCQNLNEFRLPPQESSNDIKHFIWGGGEI